MYTIRDVYIVCHSVKDLERKITLFVHYLLTWLLSYTFQSIHHNTSFFISSHTLNFLLIPRDKILHRSFPREFLRREFVSDFLHSFVWYVYKLLSRKVYLRFYCKNGETFEDEETSLTFCFFWYFNKYTYLIRWLFSYSWF